MKSTVYPKTFIDSNVIPLVIPVIMQTDIQFITPHVMHNDCLDIALLVTIQWNQNDQ